MEFGVTQLDDDSMKLKYIDEFRLSYLTDKYEWVVNSELTKTGLDGT